MIRLCDVKDMTDRDKALSYYSDDFICETKVLCPECGNVLSHGGTSNTLVGYYSEPPHNHDDNCYKREYRCSNGHRFLVSKQNKCPTCDWVGKKTCACHVGEKDDRWTEEL